MKKRPAIVLKSFQNGEYLVIPLTTKKIRNKRIHKIIIEKILIPELENSYLMFDSILRIRHDQIISLYSKGKNKKFIVLSNSTKKWILKILTEKIKNIFN